MPFTNNDRSIFGPTKIGDSKLDDDSIVKQLTILNQAWITPPIYEDMPAVWFIQVESRFALANVTNDVVKCEYVMQHLGEFAKEAEDITSPTMRNRYDHLKAELIRRLDERSRPRKIQQFLKEQMEDKRPSQFLRHLQHLAGPGASEEFVRTVWMLRLPSPIKEIVASRSEVTLKEIADIADKVHDVMPTRQVTTTEPAQASTDDLARQIADLTRRVDELTTTSNLTIR